MAIDGQCTATRRDGLPCEAQALPTDPNRRCWAHSEQQAELRREARVKGGKASGRAARLSKLASPPLVALTETLTLALTEVHDGKITPQQASAMASLGSAIIKAATAGELEERLRKLEDAQNGAARQQRKGGT